MKQYVQFNTGATDSGQNDAASISPVTDGEAATEAVFQRPSENLRARTEVVRSELEALKYIADADRTMLLSSAGDVTWDGLPAGTFSVTADLTLRPFLAPATSTPARLVTNTNAGLTNKIIVATHQLGTASQKRAYSGANQISLVWAPVPGGTFSVVKSGDPDVAYTITFNSLTTTNTGLVSALNGNTTFQNAGLVASLGGGTVAFDLVEIPSGEQAQRYLSGATDAEKHVISASTLNTFAAANPLQEGDVLCIWYDELVSSTAGTYGGRRQSIDEAPENVAPNNGADIPIGSLFLLRTNPERAVGALPVCTVAEGNLVFLNNRVYASGETGPLSSSGGSYQGSSPNKFADNSVLPASSFEAALDTLVNWLGASGSTPGGDKLGVKAIVASPVTVPAGTLSDALTAIVTGVNTHVNNATGAHAATAISTTNGTYTSASTAQAYLNALDNSLNGVSVALNAHVTDTVDAHLGTAIGYTPTTPVDLGSATTVTGALDVLDDEKASKNKTNTFTQLNTFHGRVVVKNPTAVVPAGASLAAFVGYGDIGVYGVGTTSQTGVVGVGGEADSSDGETAGYGGSFIGGPSTVSIGGSGGGGVIATGGNALDVNGDTAYAGHGGRFQGGTGVSGAALVWGGKGIVAEAGLGVGAPDGTAGEFIAVGTGLAIDANGPVSITGHLSVTKGGEFTGGGSQPHGVIATGTSAGSGGIFTGSGTGVGLHGKAAGSSTPGYAGQGVVGTGSPAANGTGVLGIGGGNGTGLVAYGGSSGGAKGATLQGSNAVGNTGNNGKVGGAGAEAIAANGSAGIGDGTSAQKGNGGKGGIGLAAYGGNGALAGVDYTNVSGDAGAGGRGIESTGGVGAAGQPGFEVNNAPSGHNGAGGGDGGFLLGGAGGNGGDAVAVVDPANGGDGGPGGAGVYGKGATGGNGGSGAAGGDDGYGGYGGYGGYFEGGDGGPNGLLPGFAGIGVRAIGGTAGRVNTAAGAGVYASSTLGYAVYAQSAGSAAVYSSKNIDVASTYGITFGGGDALDYYDVGSWTVGLSLSNGAITPSSRGGSYTRIGKVVICTGYFNASALPAGSGTLLRVTGLPFAASATKAGTLTVGKFTNFSSGVSLVQGYTAGTVAYLCGPGAGGTVDLASGDVTASLTIQFTITYVVD